MESKRKGRRSGDERLGVGSKSNEGEEAEEGVSVGDVGEGGWKDIKKIHISLQHKIKSDRELRRTVEEGERLD